MILVANISISLVVENFWRGNKKNGLEFTGKGNEFDRYMSCSQ